MRLAVLLALVACGGPISPLNPGHSAGSSVMRPPSNAPPDPVGTVRPGNRSCTEDRDCRAGERCYPPDYEPGAPAAPAVSFATPSAAAAPSPGPATPSAVAVLLSPASSAASSTSSPASPQAPSVLPPAPSPPSPAP